MKVRAVTEELKGRVPDCTAEKASKATLQSHLDQYELVGQDLEREQSSLTLLRQYALSLLHDVEVSVPTADHEQLPSLKEIKAVQDKLERCVIFLQTNMKSSTKILLFTVQNMLVCLVLLKPVKEKSALFFSDFQASLRFVNTNMMTYICCTILVKLLIKLSTVTNVFVACANGKK